MKNYLIGVLAGAVMSAAAFADTISVPVYMLSIETPYTQRLYSGTIKLVEDIDSYTLELTNNNEMLPINVKFVDKAKDGIVDVYHHEFTVFDSKDPKGKKISETRTRTTTKSSSVAMYDRFFKFYKDLIKNGQSIETTTLDLVANDDNTTKRLEFGERK